MELVSARIGQLSAAQRSVVEVLAFSEPLGIPLLVELTDALAVEQVEARGLVEVYPDGRRLQARLAHPLYGEVQRAQIGMLHARRLRETPTWRRSGSAHRRCPPRHRTRRPGADRTTRAGLGGRWRRFRAAAHLGQCVGLDWPGIRGRHRIRRGRILGP
ncbi:MAG TPA: hypothetical protein VFW64_05070 [Pseudonocardiaceae bacterium]|nr:hypothetical protein [Pseudonocardiaceae bacterium]